MKPFILCALVVFCGCTPAFYFKTPNDVLKQKGIILLNDSTRISGLITVPFEEDYRYSINNPKYIQITPDGKAAEESVPVANIDGYYMDSSFYALKSVYLFVDNIEHLLFVKRLTGQNSRIQLYHLHQTGKSNPLGEETDDYFISLPASRPYETINTRTSRMTPDFDVKMSAIVADCPTLADKIRARENAYFVPFVTLNRFKHRDVLLKIINEYNNCK